MMKANNNKDIEYIVISDPDDEDTFSAVDKIKQAAKPAITSAQLLKAKDYIKAGGSIDAIKNKYKLTASEEKTLNG